jgi:GrpB-like predicted nucleotidyltransferase (UPF0157 family)
VSEPLTDEHLVGMLVRGLCPTRIRLVDHDPAWALRYADRAAELRAVLGPRARLVEHIGSTSVPGLIAKPIVDVVVGVDDPEDEPAYLPDLEAIGYELSVREPGHRALRVGEPGRSVNLHCYRPDSEEVRRYLIFRDRLRADRADRELYAATKRELAERKWRDINYYAEAKGPTIEAILSRAGWSG